LPFTEQAEPGVGFVAYGALRPKEADQGGVRKQQIETGFEQSS